MGNNKINSVFMAFATGKETKDAPTFVNYVGISPVFILGVNPTKSELEAMYGRSIDKEPEYLGKTTVGSDDKAKEVEQIRLDFIVKTDPKFKDSGVEVISKISFFIANSYKLNSEGTKVTVINAYGETVWIPVEDAKANKVPDNMSWFDTTDMRPMYIGEDELTSFIKNYLGIANKSYKDSKTGEIITVEDLDSVKAQFSKETIANLFKGNVTDLRDIANYQPNNKVKVMFGVRNHEGREYQVIYPTVTLKNNATNYDKIMKSIEDRIAYGSTNLASTEFSVEPIHAYVVTPTEVAPVETTDDAPW